MLQCFSFIKKKINTFIEYNKMISNKKYNPVFYKKNEWNNEKIK